MKLLSLNSIQQIVTLSFVALLVAGCAGSSDTASSDQDSVVSELSAQNQTQVNFDIVVPVYVSDTLQVRLIWGDIDMHASWVGDESWVASTDLPTNTQHSLSVTFYDNNGDVELASVNSEYKTGVNAAETFYITAEQFNSAQFDVDEDGVSNLDELLAGTDPSIAESMSLELNESFAESKHWRHVSPTIGWNIKWFEIDIPTERPGLLEVDETTSTPHLDSSVSHKIIKTISVDDTGTGSFYYYSNENHSFTDNTLATREGTRTNTGSSILWDTSFDRYQRYYASSSVITASVETKAVSDTIFSQEGTIYYSNTEYYPSSNISYAFAGKASDDSEYCIADSGRLTYNFVQTGPGRLKPRTAAITKVAADSHWTVTITDDSGELVEQFFAQSLSPEFYCDFADL